MVRASRRYPLLSGGDINLYSLFVERAMSLDQAGRLRGPAYAVGDLRRQNRGASSSSPFPRAAVSSGLFDFENRRLGTELPPFFKDVHASVQILRSRLWRCVERQFRRDRVRILPTRHRHDHRRPGPLLPVSSHRLRSGESQHRHRAHLPQTAGRGDHAPHLRAASGAGRPFRQRGAPRMARPVRADVRHDQRLGPVPYVGAA